MTTHSESASPLASSMPMPYGKTQHYRNSFLADRIREQLLDIYGRACAECGATADETHLEINHIYGRDWKIRDLNRYQRYLRYRHEAKQGRINLLCPSCNCVWKPRRKEQPHGACPAFQAWLELKSVSNVNYPF